MQKLEITLKQHTPLIHFQHNQVGATLRASEVKPKLDRFILTKLGENPTVEQIIIGQREAAKEEKDFEDFGIYEKGKLIAKGLDWLIGKGEHPSLEYQMKISIENEQNIKMPLEQKMVKDDNNRLVQEYDENGEPLYKTTFPFVLSNMGGKVQSELVNFFYANRIKIILRSFVSELLAIIEDSIIEFFTLNNFGGRCNKGFGSFSVKRINDRLITFSEDYFKSNTQLLEFEINKNIDYNSFKKIFGVIDYYWKRLKSGINYGDNEYSKSFLYTYVNEQKKKTWEKRKIKEFFFLGNRHIDQNNPNPPIFARALLGLPDKFEYGSRSIMISHPDIERIMSPIYFKPIIEKGKVTIYIIVKDEHMLDVSMSSEDFKFKKERAEMSLPLNIKIDYEDLLERFRSCFDEEDSITGFYPILFNGNFILGRGNRVENFVI